MLAGLWLFCLKLVICKHLYYGVHCKQRRWNLILSTIPYCKAATLLKEDSVKVFFHKQLFYTTTVIIKITLFTYWSRLKFDVSKPWYPFHILQMNFQYIFVILLFSFREPHTEFEVGSVAFPPGWNFPCSIPKNYYYRYFVYGEHFWTQMVRYFAHEDY